MVRLGALGNPLLLCAALVCLASAAAPNSDEPGYDLSGRGLKAWQQPTGEWEVVGSVGLDSENPRRLAWAPGTGVLWNGSEGRTNNLVSREEFGDVALELEFMISEGSNSGVKFHGQYEIQILDSWAVDEPKANDCGGIYPRAELKPKYHLLDEGFPPKTNAARRPGQWQTLEAVFQSPRFDSGGRKVAHARFVKVVLNGKLIHENVEVPTPTGHAWRNPERPAGPLLLQADHGPVAFRNIRVRAWQPE